MPQTSPARRFAVAVSFPGEHRKFVRNVANALAKELGRERVFFDEWYEAELRGPDADRQLRRIYRDEASLIVPFFSEHYEKMWCQLEWHTIRSVLATRRTERAVIPVHLDGTRIDGWEPIDLGIRRKSRTGAAIAAEILSIIQSRKSEAEEAATSESARPIRSAPDHNVQIRVSPTRHGRRQLASIDIFNIGPRPFHVGAWYVCWAPANGDSFSESLNCFQGSLPRRMEDQERLQLVVDISERPVDELKELGVADGQHKLWPAESRQLANFIESAKRHALPPLREQPVERPPEQPVEVEILVTATPRDQHGSQRLQVVLTNTGQTQFKVLGAKLKWEYSAPRWQKSAPGEPEIGETEGAITFDSPAAESLLQPGAKATFFLDARRTGVLTALLAEDVADAGISIVVYRDGGFAWKVFADNVPDAVREVARNALEFEHRKT